LPSVWTQSDQAEIDDVWYQIGLPLQKHRRLFHPFMWLIGSAKHVAECLIERHVVTLDHFKRRFYEWLQHWYYSRSAFHTTVNAHVGFLCKECHSIDTEDLRLIDQPIWAEPDLNPTFIQNRLPVEDDFVRN